MKSKSFKEMGSVTVKRCTGVGAQARGRRCPHGQCSDVGSWSMSRVRKATEPGAGRQCDIRA